jgi:HAD superfamily hydrolase (TIGR01490 family)
MDENAKQTLALFDFDGTITKKDSLFSFISFTIPFHVRIAKYLLLTPFAILYKLGLVNNYHFKKMVMKMFFHKWSQSHFEYTCQNFCKNGLPKIIKMQALERIQWHKSKNDRVIVISASIEELIQYWTKELRVELIGTKLEFDEGKVTGEFSTPNCIGKEKIRRLNEELNPEEYFIYCYGDSKSDKELMRVCDEKYFKVFKK